VKLITIITQTQEFHLPAKNQITKSQKRLAHQTAKANSKISVKYWQTARIISLAQVCLCGGALQAPNLT